MAERLYHASVRDLAPDTELLPEQDLPPRVHELDRWRTERVFATDSLEAAEEWAQLIGMLRDADVVHIYEITPIGRVYASTDPETALPLLTCASAHVVRRVQSLPVELPAWMRSR